MLSSLSLNLDLVQVSVNESSFAKVFLWKPHMFLECTIRR